jgi:hypothetical protein
MSGLQPLSRAPLKLAHNKVPAFTAEEMKSYLQSAPVCAGGPTFSGDPPIIETLEFVGCQELTKRLKLSIGLADDALVCYAVLRGPFLMTLMSLPPGTPPGPHFSHRVVEIYDASTGRLLVWGGFPTYDKTRFPADER